jgi:hypothetical protein
MLPLILYIISKNPYKKSLDIARMPSAMTIALCLYISCVHDSTLLWDLVDGIDHFSSCAYCVCKNIHWDWSRHHQEHDWHAIYHSAILAHSSIVISKSDDSPSEPSCYPCVPHTYNYPYTSLIPILIANCPKPSYLLIIAMQIKSRSSLASSSISSSPFPWVSKP